MDKQEAIVFIRRELDNNRSQEEIVTLLCQELGAPPDLVRKFVAQVVAQAPNPAAAPQRQPVRPPDEAAQAPSRASASDQPVEVDAPASWPSPVRSDAAVQSDPERSALQSSWSIPEPEFDREEMEKLVLKSLSKNKRQSDVVAIVCERTGMNWGDAQRLVARVASKNRKHLAFRQNMVIIPLALIAILAGLALLYAGVSEAYVMGSAAIADPSSLAYESHDVESTVWAIPTGLMMLVGGGFGLYKALKVQFE